MRIGLIHALRHSPAPINAAFKRLWPEARLMNLLDDSLSADLVREGRLTPAMTERFLTLARYAVATRVDAILFTCSAYAPCIEACAAACDCPVLKPNEAMIDEAVMLGGRIGLLATFPATLASMPQEFPPGCTVVPCLVEGALAALERGDEVEHDCLIADTAVSLPDCDVIALAQFSMARSADLVRAKVHKPVLTAPDSAVLKLRALLTAHRGTPPDSAAPQARSLGNDGL